MVNGNFPKVCKMWPFLTFKNYNVVKMTRI